MIRVENVDSLSNFKRKSAAFLRRMKKSGQPMVLTINGKAELIVQDASSYQRLMQFADQMESVEFLQKSLEDADQGRTRPMREAVEGLGRSRR